MLYLYDEGKPIQVGDVRDEESQLRPNVVWFGEDVQNYELAIKHIVTTGRVLVVGTSLSVYPAAEILKKARFNAEKIIITQQIDKRPSGYKFLRGNATTVLPSVIDDWLNGRKVI